MLNRIVKFLSNYNAVRKDAANNPNDFLNNMCEFLVEEFQLYAAAVFKIEGEDKLTLLGKSSAAKKVLSIGSEHNCNLNKLLDDDYEPNLFHRDADLQLQITEFVMNEGSILIKPGNGISYLLKIVQKQAFSQIDEQNFSVTAEFLNSLLSLADSSALKQGDSIQQLISNFANDFRTPINSVVGFASLLEDEKLSDTQIENITSLKSNAQKLAAMINDLVDIAKVDSGNFDVKLENIDLRSFFQNVIKIFYDKTGKKQILFDVRMEKSLAEEIAIEQEKLKVILLNMLIFLLQETESGKIIIEISKKQNKFQIRITNKGLVIPSSIVNQFNNQNAVISTDSGSGNLLNQLSLNLVKRYVKVLEGSLRLGSNAGEGTFFTISFNFEETPSTIEDQIKSLPKDKSNNRVLVIEDDYATSKLLSNYLNKWGYEPTIVNGGKKALDIIEKENFLAIITDIVLPDINGLELLKNIRENESTKFTPIIVCSVEAEQQKAFMMGAVEYFVKPISYKDLVEVLTSYKLKKDSKVLCVDDDVPTLNLIKEAIESVGVTPIAEAHSTKVMERIKDVDLDLAIVDLDMPEINGFELIKLIKSEEQFKNVPIIIYTGKENYDEDLEKIDGLFTDLLDKRSTKIEDLAETINGMISKYETPTRPEEISEEPKPQKPEAEEKTVEAAVPQILLVEDYKHSQIIVTRLLKKNGFTKVIVVENGAEAVENVQKMKFDLILMDMQMPVMNGFEATERIRKMPDYSDTPIIALTAFAMKGDREKCIEAGATDYIPKPIDSQDFIEKVKYFTKQS